MAAPSHVGTRTPTKSSILYNNNLKVRPFLNKDVNNLNNIYINNSENSPNKNANGRALT